MADVGSLPSINQHKRILVFIEEMPAKNEYLVADKENIQIFCWLLWYVTPVHRHGLSVLIFIFEYKHFQVILNHSSL